MITLLAVLLSSVILIAVFGAFYVVYALGVRKLMIAEGLDNTYRAWVPIWNSFVLGEILEQETEGFQFTYQNTTKWIVAFAPLFSMVPAIGSFVALAAGIYVIVLCAVMASKQGTTASMIISSLLGFSGIGLMIYASRLMETDPGRKMEEKDPFAAPPSQEEATVVDFTVEAADEKSAAAPAAKREPVYAKPEGSRGTVVATPEKMGTVEAAPKGEVAFQETVELTGDNKEFDIPLNTDDGLDADGQYVEFDITEE
ncbi:MAG: hypothetical protein KBS68_02190 [Clostridiales bacterium]|nr:hypothetical protein [Candidatus Crickella merdequi]